MSYQKKALEKETIDLKNKNKKLENNLKLLTNSHQELEKIINSENSGLKSEIDIKDQKYNDLLKELQLKDIHIKSLENLFDKQNQVDPGRIFTKINAFPIDINDNNKDGLNTTFNNNDNNGNEFKRDEVTEMKLNKLINNYEIKNKINNFNNNNQNEYNNNPVELKDLVKLSGGE